MAQETTFDTAQIMIDFTQMKSFGQDPLILEEGKGIRVTDVFGKSYIDGLSGVFTVNFGHGVDELVDVAAEQGRKISFTAPTMATNPAALRLADLLIKITPEQYSTVKFLSADQKRPKPPSKWPGSISCSWPRHQIQDHLPLHGLSRRHRQRDGGIGPD